MTSFGSIDVVDPERYVLCVAGQGLYRFTTSSSTGLPAKKHNAITDNYRKVPKFWDTRNLCCNLPKIQTKSPISPKGY